MYQSSGQFGVSDGGASPDVVFGRETEKCLVVMRKLRAARVTHVVGGRSRVGDSIKRYLQAPTGGVLDAIFHCF